jgi:hypothetical protein
MAKEQKNTTQQFIPIKEIRDGVIILKNGGMRAVVMASSLNFALKSIDEQTSIIMQFQNFLNSLDFPVQIFVQSKKLDIRPYIAMLESRYKEQTTDLMKIQVQEYIGFIKAFVENTNIMTKGFFAVVPYEPAMIDAGGSLASIMGHKTTISSGMTKTFEEHKSQLAQRVSVVEQGLVRCGVRAAELGTEEIVELFYKLFNPGETEKPIQIT